MIVEKVYADKYYIYSDKLQKIICCDEKTARQLNLLLMKRNGVIYRYSKNNDFVATMKKMGIIYTNKIEYIKRVSEVRKIISRKKVFRPQEAYLHLTQRCNLNCTYCYNKINLNKIQELTTLQWKQAIDIIHRLGVKKCVLTGGEVFLRTDLLEIVNYLVSKNIGITILSNGTLCDSAHNIGQILSKISKLVISLDSIDTIQNAENRRRSENYNIVKNINEISTKYKKNIFVRMVVSNKNENSVDNMRRFVEHDLGVNFIPSSYIPNTPDEIDFIPRLADNIYNFNSILMKQSNCGACNYEFAINCNGDIYPCQTLIKPKFKLGNIFDNNFVECINRSKIRRMFSNYNINKIKKCKKCNIKYLCGGGCRAISYNLYGNIYSKNEPFCSIYKSILHKQLSFKILKYLNINR